MKDRQLLNYLKKFSSWFSFTNFIERLINNGNFHWRLCGYFWWNFLTRSEANFWDETEAEFISNRYVKRRKSSSRAVEKATRLEKLFTQEVFQFTRNQFTNCHLLLSLSRPIFPPTPLTRSIARWLIFYCRQANKSISLVGHTIDVFVGMTLIPRHLQLSSKHWKRSSSILQEGAVGQKKWGDKFSLPQNEFSENVSSS